MFLELALTLDMPSLHSRLKREFVEERTRVARCRFDENSEKEREKEKERLFRKLLQEVQKGL